MDGIDQSLIGGFVRRKEACETPEELRKFMKSARRKPAPPEPEPPVVEVPRVLPKKEPLEAAPKGTIYFILDRTAQAVKIGFSANEARVRLKFMQPWCVNTLEIIHTMPGNQYGGDSATVVSEAGLHRRFKKHRVRGEWFRWCPEIEEFIKPKPYPNP